MRSNRTNYYSFRIRLEKLKQKAWRGIVIAKILFFLANIVFDYLKRT